MFCPDLLRSLLRHPQLVFATALIKLIFLSVFLTVSSTCGLNDSQRSTCGLSKIAPSNLGVRLNGTTFSMILKEGFQSHSTLDMVKKVDLLFVLLSFNFNFLFQLYTALTAFCRAF